MALFLVAEYGGHIAPVSYTHLDVYKRQVDPGTAQIVLDILARQARGALLIGHRLICLVQSNDPQLSFEPVGAMPVAWNDAEWLNSKRCL